MTSVFAMTALAAFLTIAGVIAALVWFFLFRETKWYEAVTPRTHCPACGREYKAPSGDLSWCVKPWYYAERDEWRDRWCGQLNQFVTEEGEIVL